MSLWRDTVLGVTRQPRVQQLVEGNALVRPLRDRFVAGETLSEVLATARPLHAAGFRLSLDHLGEDVDDAAAADRHLTDYLALVEAIGRDRLRSGISIKLTQLGLALDAADCQARLERLLAAAAAHGIFVRVDMEGSAYTGPTLDLVRAVWPRHRNVGVVLQAYLYRTAADLEDVLARGITVRLCKGAYAEPPEIAFPSKADVDANYRRLLRVQLAAAPYAAIATHDEALIAAACREVARLGRARDSFEFQMLYGVRRDLQAALLRAGYRVRLYVPYGREWYPYLTRRLAERPSNLLFVARALWAERNGARAA